MPRQMGDSRYTDPETGHKFQTEHDLILYELLQELARDLP